MSEPIHPNYEEATREWWDKFVKETDRRSPFEFFAYFKDFKGIIPITNPTA